MLARVKSYKELKDADWFVEDMRVYCGKTYKVLCEIDERFICLEGCRDWQFAKDGVELAEKHYGDE